MDSATGSITLVRYFNKYLLSLICKFFLSAFIPLQYLHGKVFCLKHVDALLK